MHLRDMKWGLFPLSLVISAGCNDRDASAIKKDTADFAHHTSQAVGSVALAGKVNTALSLRKGIEMNGIHVQAQDGVVTLEGHVRTEVEHKLVVDATNNTTGVNRVIDRLKVTP